MTNKTILYLLVLVLLLLGQFAAGAMIVFAFQQPLAQRLDLIVATPTLTLPVATLPEQQIQATLTPTPRPTEAGKICGMSGKMIILMVGRDADIWEPPFGADSIRLIKIDLERREIIVVAFPRDLYLPTPALEKRYGVERFQLGPAYTAVLQKEQTDPNADILATNVIAQTLYDNFSVISDHYFTMKETIILDVINIFDEIEVEVPADFVTPDLTIKAGRQVLDAETIQYYIQYLESANTEWDRFNRQNVVINALRDKFIQPSILAKVPSLYREFKESIITDLSYEQIVMLSCVMHEIPGERVSLLSLPPEMVSFNEQNEMILKDPEAVREYVREIIER